MTWTTTKPNHEGWWWQRFGKNSRPAAVYVYQMGGKWYYDRTELVLERVRDKNCEWSSEPIPKPMEGQG